MSSAEEKAYFEMFLEATLNANATDLHIQVGQPPLFRVNGSLVEATEDRMICDYPSVSSMVNAILSPEQMRRYNEAHNLDMSYNTNASHFRVNISQEQGKPYITARVIPNKIRELADIGFPNDIWKEIIGLERGLVLVTGVTGSGKSTTLASLIQEINRTQENSIITIEDPIEYVHPRIKSSIKQRELYRDVNSFADGVEQAMRQDPDIILVGEIKDYKTAISALVAAETGHLVFSTLHTKDSQSTISRLVDCFPIEDKGRVRAAVADNLAYLICQQLVPYERTGKRVVAMELFKNTSAMRNLIRTDQDKQIPSGIQTGFKEGMISMDRHLEQLFLANRISAGVAVRYALDRAEMIANLNKRGFKLD